MASENETVAEIREDVHEYLTSIGPGEYPDETQFEEFADRFVAAHKRESALIAKLKIAEDALDKVYRCIDNRYGVDASLLAKNIIADALAAIRKEGGAE